MSRNLSEQDLYSLFAELATDDMPSGMASRIEEKVMAQVHETFPANGMISEQGPGWLARTFGNLKLPSLQLLPSFALGAAAAVVIVVLMLNPQLINRLIGIDTGPNTGSSTELATTAPEPTAIPEPTGEEEAEIVPTNTPIDVPVDTPTQVPTATPTEVTTANNDENGVAGSEATTAENPADAGSTADDTTNDVESTDDNAAVAGTENEPTDINSQTDNASPSTDVVVEAGEDTVVSRGPATAIENVSGTDNEPVAEDNASSENSSETQAGNSTVEDATGAGDQNESIALVATATLVSSGESSSSPLVSTATPVSTSTIQATRTATSLASGTTVPTATSTPRVAPTSTATPNLLLAPPTKTPIPTRAPLNMTSTASPSPTPSLTPTALPTDTPESTAVASDGAEPEDDNGQSESVATATSTKTPQANTPVPTDTPVPAVNTDTPVPTFTVTLTSTPVPTDTATPKPTVNPAPDADDYSVTVIEDATVTLDLLDRISDANDDSIEISIVKTVNNGEISIQNGSVITYKPAPDFHGEDILIVAVTDSGNASDSGIVTFIVKPVNDLPIALGDNYQVVEDTSIVMDVLANDTDVDGDSLKIVDVVDAQNGTVTMVDGQISYKPNLNYNGDDSFTYTVGDDDGQVSAIVTLQVEPAQDEPVPGSDQVVGNEDTPIDIDVLSNDTDVDGDPLQITEVFDISHGTVEIINDGDAVRFVPPANMHGNAQFRYRVTDRNIPVVGVVSVQVQPAPDAPQAFEDVVHTQEDTAVTFPPLANDVDIDGDVLTLVGLTTQPTQGRIEQLGDGTLRYTPAINFNGSDTFTYRIEDGTGLGSEGKITVNVTAFNDTPVAQPDEVQGAEDTPLVLDVLANDSDPDGSALFITGVSATDKGLLTFEGATLTFVPNANFTGVVDVTYDISDGSSSAQSTAQFTVLPVQDAPSPVEDIANGTEDSAVDIFVLANDIEVDGEQLTILSASAPSFGTATVVENRVVYTPQPNFYGSDSFTYVVSDGIDNATATVLVTMVGVNDPPVVQNKIVEISEDSPLVDIDVLAGATDQEGDTLTIAQISKQPTLGTAAVVGNRLHYTPHANQHGEDVVKLLISDGGDVPQELTVTIRIASVIDEPVAEDDTFAILEDTPSTLDVIDNDIDPEVGNNSTLRIVGVSQPANNHSVTLNADNTLRFVPAVDYTGQVTLTYNIISTSGAAGAGSLIIKIDPVNDAPVAVDDLATMEEDGQALLIDVLANDTDVDTPADQLTLGLPAQEVVGLSIEANKIRYQPQANLNGVVAIKYTVTDNASPPVEGTVTVTITPVNDAPVTAPDTETTTESTAVTVLVLTNDVDPDGDPLTVSNGAPPTNGTAVANGTEVVYTPNVGFVGTDSFTYALSDGKGGEPILGVVTVEVLAPPPSGAGNLPPVAIADTASTNIGTLANITVLDNDLDPDGVDLTISVIATPQNGLAVLSADKKSIDYTPNAGFIGEDTFTYTIVDAGGLTAEATVSISVVDDSGQASEGPPQEEPADENSAPTTEPEAGAGDSTEVDASGTFSLTHDSPDGTVVVTATVPLTETAPTTP